MAVAAMDPAKTVQVSSPKDDTVAEFLWHSAGRLLQQADAHWNGEYAFTFHNATRRSVTVYVSNDSSAEAEDFGRSSLAGSLGSSWGCSSGSCGLGSVLPIAGDFEFSTDLPPPPVPAASPSERASPIAKEAAIALQPPAEQTPEPRRPSSGDQTPEPIIHLPADSADLKVTMQCRHIRVRAAFYNEGAERAFEVFFEDRPFCWCPGIIITFRPEHGNGPNRSYFEIKPTNSLERGPADGHPYFVGQTVKIRDTSSRGSNGGAAGSDLGAAANERWLDAQVMKVQGDGSIQVRFSLQFTRSSADSLQYSYDTKASTQKAIETKGPRRSPLVGCAQTLVIRRENLTKIVRPATASTAPPTVGASTPNDEWFQWMAGSGSASSLTPSPRSIDNVEAQPMTLPLASSHREVKGGEQ